MTRQGPPHATSTDLLVLHALRCIGFAGLGRVAAATGLPEPDVESELIDLAVAGLVSCVAGDFGGWGLTEAGRAVDAERIAGALDYVTDSTVWFQLHEDLLATLGIPNGSARPRPSSVIGKGPRRAGPVLVRGDRGRGWPARGCGTPPAGRAGRPGA
jgi:hypothetical protein